ncbi:MULTISPECIES: helix-turn-helix transcriptional regulator [Streptomyces]|jgi:DNA-binding CsgD family transcriptional regulator|uniref:helix-turn-helix transcriptional regulator n=1 Tax=Streptomyces TaxID=1883 RepID=UPI000F73B27C|nr:helix-turn-helix transcriptional regulator [Streptomyces sp. WAC05292]RSS87676.1 helix-turn-helix transcriptional regulator [Streptomyces sp. WAC05292]
MGSIGMRVLGLSDLEEGIYRHFLRNPDTTDGEIHLLLRADRGDVSCAQARLCELGLLYPTERKTLIPADPAIAVDRLTDLRLRELHSELQEVTRSRYLVAELSEEQSPTLAAQQSVERMEDVAQIRSRIDDLAFFAREEILSVEPYTALTPENIEHSRPLDMRCLRRGIQIRNVVLKEALDDPLTVGYLRELTAKGAQIRAAEDLSERMLVYDRRTALVPIDPEDTSRGALVAQETGLVSGILALFEKIWGQATDLSAIIADAAGEDCRPGELADTEREVLRSMCHVGKDEIGARQLGMSVRTYRRHVADLLRTLGASSRPHAALLARERGWI